LKTTKRRLIFLKSVIEESITTGDHFTQQRINLGAYWTIQPGPPPFRGPPMPKSLRKVQYVNLLIYIERAPF